MKTLAWALATGMAAILLSNCTESTASEKTQTSNNAMTAAELVKRGEYLVTTMGCNDCHTPKIMTDQGPALDTKRLLSGHPANVPLAPIPDKDAVRRGDWVMMHPMVTAFAGPWGTSYAANLTPDPTGLGSWNYEQFKKALTEGKFKGLDGGRMLLPPMPWQNCVNMTDEDLKAMFAYFQSIPPVENVVPTPASPADL